MSTSKGTPKNLADFAQLANISTESLNQIVEKLNQADIPINDPYEELSNQTKAKLLAFFRGSNDINTKQTRISKLSSGISSTKQVTITTVSRRPISSETTQSEELIDEIIPTQAQKESITEVPVINNLPNTELSKTKRTLSENTQAEATSTPEKLPKHHSQPTTQPTESKETLNTKHLPHDPTIPNQTTGSLAHEFKKPTKLITKDIWIPESITLSDLAKKMSAKDTDVIMHLEKIGITSNHYNQPIDQETAAILVEEMGHHPRLLKYNIAEISLRETLDQQMSQPSKRPPIITVMGHVDHGKTSLLDYIRRTQVAVHEKGGITQHVGAYQVEHPKGIITFLDTPGHAAFTAMRARGAQLTDIVALVVAADDGVMPQTIEAIEHATAAKVPIVVAITKLDKPGVTIELAQQGLAKYNLISEEWGGETLFVPCSSKTGEGINDLLNALLLQAEIGEIVAALEGPGQGIIVESRLDKAKGPVATLIVKKGTLKKGDILLAGTSFGRIKALNNAQGKAILSASPSTPVEVLGLSHPPLSGEEAIVVSNERKAREIKEARLEAIRETQRQAQMPRSLDILTEAFNQQPKKLITLILKSDVQGSAEALKESLLKLSTEQVTLKVLMTGVGVITESDVNLAIASKATIFGFNVRIDNMAKRLIQKENVVIHQHAIIYELLDTAQKMINSVLGPQSKETLLGKASVREIFRTSKNTIVAGCIVTEGTIDNHHNVRITREQVSIHQGKLSSLRRFKDDVKEVSKGLECGISIKNYLDIKVGDMIESYDTILIT